MPPEVWWFRHVLGVQIPSQEAFGCVGQLSKMMGRGKCISGLYCMGVYSLKLEKMKRNRTGSVVLSSIPGK